MKNPLYCGVGQLSEAVCKYSKAREVSAAETSYTLARPTSRRKTCAQPEHCTCYSSVFSEHTAKCDDSKTVRWDKSDKTGALPRHLPASIVCGAVLFNYVLGDVRKLREMF